MKKGPSLSIIIPVFNEENSIGYVLEDTLKNLPQLISDFEIIVVDDGSKDNTLDIVKSFSKKFKRIRVISQKHLGYGTALSAGIKVSKKDYVANMQGNGQDLIRDMVNSIKVMGNYDLTLGIRGKRIDYDLYRFILSYGGMLLYRLFFGIKYEDVHWSYIWERKELIKLTIDSNAGLFSLVETLIEFQKNSLSIIEVASPYRPRFAGASKVTDTKNIFNLLLSMFKFWWKIHV